MSRDLIGKAGVVTGAARGIGRAIALHLLDQGASVVGVDRQPIAPPNGFPADAMSRWRPLQIDLSREQSVVGMIEHCLETFGDYNYIVQNAAVQIEKSLHETTEADWDAIMTVNLRSLFWGCKHSIAAMETRGGGSIVNMASALAFVADPLLAAYTIAKHGVLGLTRTVGASRAYAAQGIRCNCIAPGDVATVMGAQYVAASSESDLGRHYPTGRIGLPAEVARIAAFLVSDESSLINAAAIAADGGLTAQCYR
jgi:NAD(P)-dependent dehydrogenase (short-subunit alcohol dehydrogenase family)